MCARPIGRAGLGFDRVLHTWPRKTYFHAWDCSTHICGATGRDPSQMFQRLLKRDVRAQGASDAWGAGLTYRARRAEGARLGRGGFHRELAIGALCPGAWGGRAIPRTRRSWPRAAAGTEPVRFPSVRGKSMGGDRGRCPVSWGQRPVRRGTKNTSARRHSASLRSARTPLPIARIRALGNP